MDEKTQPLVSVVILNWNRIQDTLACLESVRKLNYKNYEVVVVDNGSVDGSKEKLAAIKDIIFVDNPKNRGFTGGHIDGYARSKGEFILLLNNDAVIDPDYISIAVEDMLKDPTVGAVGGRAYAWDDTHPPYDATGKFYGYQNINVVSAEAIFVQTDSGLPREINNVSGSGVLVRRTTIDTVGYLFGPYFAYYEETDLFARMKRAGFKVMYNPRLHIWHKSGVSSSSYFQFNQLFKNRFIFAVRNFDRGNLPAFLKSYLKTGLTSTYLRMRGVGNKDHHKGFSNAFFYSCLTWPRAFYYRYTLKRELPVDHSYNQSLLVEQTSVSIIVDATKVPEKEVRQLAGHLDSLGMVDARFDIILVTTQAALKTKAFSSVKIAYLTNQFPGQGINIGWLSAKHQFVLFGDGHENIDDLHDILRRVVHLQRKGLWMDYGDQTAESLLIDKELLIKHGGLVISKSLTDNARHLGLYAYFHDKRKIAVDKSQLRTITTGLPEGLQNEIRDQVHLDKSLEKASGKWESFLQRHYRIFQSRNTLKWLVSSRIPLRLKLARIKNLVVFALTFRRKLFALELKHIRNEVIRSSFSGEIFVEREKISREVLQYATQANNWKKTPVFIICRDRVDSLRLLLRWFKRVGMQNITLIDNDSLYPPLVKLFEDTSYQVIHTQENIGHTVPWTGGIIKTLVRDKPYILTDPDVIPIAECPMDVVKYIYELHLKYFEFQKIGLGLKIDDLPKHYSLRDSVITWEKQFWKHEIEPRVYEAAVDTTFALYKPFTHQYFIHTSIRTGEPYTARHMPWYADSSHLTKEDVFYRQRASGNITTWNSDELGDRYHKEIKKLKG